MGNDCLFNEPWMGRCNKPATLLCCETHTTEKCHVCGSQALTRCQASIGLMCGRPMCNNCGQETMCLYHASNGPLAIIRHMLGGNVIINILSEYNTEEQAQEHFDKNLERLLSLKFS